uniref:S1 motif domain-containing protein n=1 Tax=viral metagenome TaxID=1070528 RepID=A0A6C0EE31_9ZZZZ
MSSSEINDNFINFYSKNDPIIDELVLIHIIEKCDSFFKAKLIEYNYNGIMNFQDATKKKKVISWNKILQFNKNIVAKVTDIDKNAKIVQLSVTYLHDDSLTILNTVKISNEKLFSQIQDKLMKYFNENKQLEHFIKSFSILNNDKDNIIYNYNYIWKNLIHFIDSQRENNKISIWKYFNDNIIFLKDWIEKSNFDDDFYKNFINFYNKKNKESNYKLITKVGLISLVGVTIIKEIINKILNDINFTHTFKYDSTPYYLLESNSEDTNDNDHFNFLEKLKIECVQYPNIFIKIDYCAKKKY